MVIAAILIDVNAINLGEFLAKPLIVGGHDAVRDQFPHYVHLSINKPYIGRQLYFNSDIGLIKLSSPIRIHGCNSAS